MCPNHEEIALGISQAQFTRLFNNKSGGFRVSFDSIGQNLFIKWYDVVNSPHDLMFFGRPLPSNRPMDYLFANKNNDNYAHHVFRHFSSQYYGDSKQSAILYSSYLNCLRRNASKREAAALAREAGMYDKQTLLTPEVKHFCNVFNNHCRYAFMFSVSSFQNYTDPLILVDDWRNFVEVAKRVMDTQWRVLASYRNITSSDPPELVAYKERQIFCQLMTMIRIANFRLLNYWSLVLTTAYYGCGVRGTAVLATSFWGITTSRSYRNAKYSEFIDNIDQAQKSSRW
jgi:hypothetical protein